ncbi:MAG: DUF6122 family protein [SAR324 cluster bacterium]|nr:DUF6122 family protein [SAR324 cluster bacterium]
MADGHKKHFSGSYFFLGRNLSRMDYVSVLERTLVHNFLHFLIPALATWIFYQKDWRSSYIFLMITMMVDLDHLIADPIFDPQRCSIGFHPLHSEIAITIFALMLIHKKLRIFGFGLLIHMSLDGLDCTWMTSFSPGIPNS